MTAAVLSIGSNVGDRHALLQLAVDMLRPWFRAASPVYETPPWGPVRQEHYLNAVVEVADPSAEPAAWLARAQAAEVAARRTREVRWGPRTLDVDVVTVVDEQGELASADPALTLPHPRAAERAFVLVPWLALNPRASLGGRPVRELLQSLSADDVAAVREVATLR